MPYKLKGNCVHKYDPDTKRLGEKVKCHSTREKALAHMKALYANVEKEVTMSSSRKTRKQKRPIRSANVTPEAVLKEQEIEEEEVLDLLDEKQEPVEKSYYESAVVDMGIGNAKSWEEVEQMEAVAEQTEKVEQAAYTTRRLVSNILYDYDMGTSEKAEAIKKVADGFVFRVGSTMKKEADADLELLEIETMLAKEARDMSIGEQVTDWLTKKKLTSSSRQELSDSDFALPDKRKYPIHDKAHVRNALARAAQQIKSGDEEAKRDARAALPKIRSAAKKFGIGMSKEAGSLLIEKDANGDWRWVGWPTNNYKDRDGDIVRKSAHEEYVEWVNKNMDVAPLFATWHTPGTERTHPVDYVGFTDGFLVVSGKLTDNEASDLMRVQKEIDLGLSIGAIAIRDKSEPNVINWYRCYEISDLPLEKAANPWSEVTILTKEAVMEKMEYFTQLLGEERAKAFLEKTAMKKEALDEAQIESKETKEQPPQAPQPAPAADYEAILEKVKKELDIDGLAEFVTKAQEAMEKVPLLEELVEQLSKDRDDELAEKISPPISRQFPWSARASQADETILKETKEDKALEASQPDLHWISEAFHVQPLKSEQ